MKVLTSAWALISTFIWADPLKAVVPKPLSALPSRRVPRTNAPFSPWVTHAYTLMTSFWLTVPVTAIVIVAVFDVEKLTSVSNLSDIKAMQKALVGLVDDSSVTAGDCGLTTAPAFAPN